MGLRTDDALARRSAPRYGSPPPQVGFARGNSTNPKDAALQGGVFRLGICERSFWVVLGPRTMRDARIAEQSGALRSRRTSCPTGCDHILSDTTIYLEIVAIVHA